MRTVAPTATLLMVGDLRFPEDHQAALRQRISEIGNIAHSFSGFILEALHTLIKAADVLIVSPTNMELVPLAQVLMVPVIVPGQGWAQWQHPLALTYSTTTELTQAFFKVPLLSGRRQDLDNAAVYMSFIDRAKQLTRIVDESLPPLVTGSCTAESADYDMDYETRRCKHGIFRFFRQDLFVGRSLRRLKLHDFHLAYVKQLW